MAAWRDVLARFRGESADKLMAGALALAPAVVKAEPPIGVQSGTEQGVPVAATASLAQTAALDDTTRPLSPLGPQSVVLRGERVLAAAALRDIGRERHENQDHCFAQVLFCPSDQRNLALGLFVVADGMGGHHDGGYASKLALSTVVQTVLTELIAPVLGADRPTPQPILQAAVQAANAAVHEAGQQAGSDMGTTCTAALVYGSELIVAHVGDSRALLIGGGVKQLTTDHTAVGRLIAIGALTPEEAHDHPLRNQLYRSIGQQASVAVEVTTTPLRDQTHLVLCSDGLWGLVSEANIADIVTEAPTPHMAARHLIAQANLVGGHDNIAAVVVTLPTAGEARS